jgi:hypothetical protein
MSETQVTVNANKVVFLCEDRPFDYRDVIDAACFRGELEPVWKDFLRLVAAERKADTEELEVDDEAIESAAEQFRYERDLITAEETERWLAERGLTLHDFGAHFVRHYWAKRWPEIDTTPLNYLSAPNDLHDLLTNELILSGELDRMALRLSRRIAARCGAKGQSAGPELIAEEQRRFRERHSLTESQTDDWLERLGREADWLNEMLATEAIYRRDCAALLTQREREREISALRLPLTRFQVETVEFDSLNSAREAILCVREDGMALKEIATEGRYPYRKPQLLLEEIPDDLQQKFLSVQPGEILEPIPRGDRFHLYRVIGKEGPDPDDPIVRKRIENVILDRHFAHLTTRYIHWRIIPA